MPLSILRVMGNHTGAVSRASWTRDGRYVMTCGHDKTIRLWNPNRSGPDTSSEASRRSSKNNDFRESALEVKVYSGPHSHEVAQVAIAADNARFASCGGDRACFLWDVTTGSVTRRFEGHAQRINDCVFAGDEDTVLLTASYDRTVRCWDLRSRSREPIQILKDFRDSVTSVCATNYEIIGGCVDGSVRIYDLRAGQCRVDELSSGQETAGAFQRIVTSTSLSHDGKCILASCTGGKPLNNETWKPGPQLNNKATERGHVPASVVLLEKATGALLNKYEGHQHADYSLQSCLTHTDAHVVSGCESGAVLVWDLVEGGVVQRIENAHERAVAGVACHPSQPMLVTCSFDSSALLWQGSYS